MNKCYFCGEPVADDAWTLIGGTHGTFLCDATECNNEALDAERECQDRAVEEAQRDNYERYL